MVVKGLPVGLAEDNVDAAASCDDETPCFIGVCTLCAVAPRLAGPLSAPAGELHFASKLAGRAGGLAANAT